MQDNDRHALLIGVSGYDSPQYQDLAAVRADLHYMQAVLERTDIGMFNPCTIAAEPTAAQLKRVVEDFLAERTGADTALLYFSGHGQYSVDDGQLYFITRDSDPEDLPNTAVAAEFLHEQLQECRASAKVVLLDCCDSGSVVQSWSAKGPGGPEAAKEQGVMLRPSGVYVITASGARQTASAKAPEGSTLGTSRFTGEIVEGLRTGRMTDRNWVTADDLFAYVSQQLRASDGQVPTRSMLAATQTLRLARGVASPVTLPPQAGRPAVGTPSIPDKALRRAAEEQAGSPRWTQLTEYYLACMSKEAAADWLPSRGQQEKYLLLGGHPELLQSGSDDSVGAPDQLPGSALRGPSEGTEQNTEIWYGYPTVTLPAPGGRRNTADGTRLAPLLIQQLELSVDEGGRRILRPASVPIPHPGLLAEFLDAHEQAELVAGWQPDWQHGHAAQMLQNIRQLLKVLGIDEIQPLDPQLLQENSVRREVRLGAHNTAMLLTSTGADKMTIGLVDNLRKLSDRAHEIERTALSALVSDRHRDSRHPTPKAVADRSDAPIVSAGPLNERQEEVIRSVLRDRLTVATGPAGTGKSQLVTALVQTATQLGWKTCVVSTNNQAVDEVERRCSALVSGLLLRTGNQTARAREAETVSDLLQHTSAPECSPATAAGELRIAHAEVAAARARLADIARNETALSATAAGRSEALSRIGVAPSTLAGVWTDGGDRLRRWADRADKATRAGAWQLGPWRRRRAGAALLSGLGSDAPGATALASRLSDPADGATTLAVLAKAATAEWELRRGIPRFPLNATTAALSGLAAAQARAAEASARLMRSTIATRIRHARPQLQARLGALQRGTDLRRTQRELMDALGGWAITTHSVQQLDLTAAHFDLVIVDEASQCAIPSVLPMLFRAERALIIGDPAQLGQISKIPHGTDRSARAGAGLTASWLEERRLGYSTSSAYDAAAHAHGGPILLDEHYRCHPDIVDLPNRACYGGRLRVLTDVRTLRRAGSAPAAPLRWIDVPNSQPLPGPNGSWKNSTELRKVIEIVAELQATHSEDTRIGIITPFKEQRKQLQRRFDGSPVKVGTVHAFQGGECDVIILSLVANADSPRTTVNWLRNEARLWNVAITRAKAQLITVGDRAFWSQQGGMAAGLAARAAADPPATPLGTEGGDPLGDGLHALLLATGHRQIQREVRVEGHACDFLLATDRGITALLIDRGPEPDEDPARQLRLRQAAADLLPGLRAATSGPFAGPITDALRIPAWRILAADHAGDPLRA
ncbi:AAA domain-containing protein [Kitasatospora sp. NPDC093806]|uniref:caspase, EACC1-associated type n=1 Tax=Kitasatospora sp. NPDC093806 TaxID=3155075 RepID=UPI003427C7AB